MKNKGYYNWFYVPDDKFMKFWDIMKFWDNDVIDFEQTESGWIFWVLN